MLRSNPDSAPLSVERLEKSQTLSQLPLWGRELNRHKELTGWKVAGAQPRVTLLLLGRDRTGSSRSPWGAWHQDP